MELKKLVCFSYISRPFNGSEAMRRGSTALQGYLLIIKSRFFHVEKLPIIFIIDSIFHLLSFLVSSRSVYKDYMLAVIMDDGIISLIT